VNHFSHPDLYYALRGGGNNFGIVTRFDMETFPQGKMWGGYNLFIAEDMNTGATPLDLGRPLSTLDWFAQKLGRLAVRVACRLGYCETSNAVIQALEKTSRDTSDPFAHFFGIFFLVPKIKVYMAGALLAYGKK
jgi:hypothetical protein